MSSSSEVEAVREVLARYMVAIDDMIAGDPDGLDVVMSCFAPDATLHYPGAVARGTEEMRDMFTGTTPRDDPAFDGFTRLPVSTHAMLTMHAVVEDDAADTRLSATANLCGVRDGTEIVMVRGLRYLDHLEKGSEGWSITERHLVVDWQYEVPATGVAQPRFELPRH